jgi:PII-like signaling protein
VSDEYLKLTSYFDERDRTGHGFLADAMSEISARHELRASIVIRGVAGFGEQKHFHTDRELTLSENLPVVSVAVDTRSRIEAALADVQALRFSGLVTLERARTLEHDFAADEQTKLTVYLGRQERHRDVVQTLHEAGVAGATVLLGVDGTAHGERRRARFFSRNADVPLMVVSVGDGDRIASVLPALGGSFLTLERVTVCKRDGRRLADPPRADGDLWQKLMVYAGEQARHDGHPLYLSLLRRLQAAGAAGATSLRGVWGYHGDHQPHGDTLWQLQRRVPVVTVIVDAPERMQRWFEIVDEVTSETGLVTSELVRVTHLSQRGLAS